MSVGITTLAQKLGWVNIGEPDRKYKEGDSFTIYKLAASKFYVEPFLSEINGNLDDRPQIVLISCPGAVGKSALSRYLSAKYNMPVFDLAIHKAVGDSTMTGILADKYPDLTIVKRELKTGKESIIIDALDEGLLKVSTDGFFAFIDDIIKLTKECSENSTPFVMTGRPGIAFETAKYLESNGINCLWLEIESFTKSQANLFIDKRVLEKNGLKYTEPYKEAKELIIDSIECFFKQQKDAEHKNYTNFLGYAPVLIAISDMFGPNPNYQNIINRLKSRGYRNIQLLIDIVQSIMDRDRNEKVFPELVDGIVAKRDEEFKKLVAERVYNYEEQCARVLSIVLGIESEIRPVEDQAFLSRYSEQITSFANEHPFLESGKIQNAVFESFVLAILASTKEYSWLVEEYMETQLFKNSFALFPIFASLNGTSQGDNSKIKPLSVNIASELAESFNSIASGNIKSEVILEECDNKGSNHKFIDADFVYYELTDSSKRQEFNLLFELDQNNKFNLKNGFKSTTISGDFELIAFGERIVLQAPVKIDCKQFTLSCDELQIIGDDEAGVTITAEKVEINNIGKNYPTIKNLYSNLKFHTDSKPPYPLSQYVRKENYESQQTYDKAFFNKIRRLLLSFCCDSKGQGNWAKHKGKIDSRFSRGLGRQALYAMIENAIIYSDNILYKINVPKLEELLGVKYDNLSSCRPSEKMVAFMNKIRPLNNNN